MIKKRIVIRSDTMSKLSATESTWEKRELHGYAQSRERRLGYSSGWRFYVSGFNERRCSVLRADGTIDYHVAINSKSSILIAGRWFSYKHWDH